MVCSLWYFTWRSFYTFGQGNYRHITDTENFDVTPSYKIYDCITFSLDFYGK